MPKVLVMFDLSGFEAGSAAVALTGAVLGWSLRPLFLRYRRAFVVAVAVLAAAGAAAYDAFDQRVLPEPSAPAVVRQAPARVTALPLPAAAPSATSEALAEYLDNAGRGAFAEGDYAAASRYWRDAAQLSPRLAGDLADAIARAERLAAERL